MTFEQRLDVYEQRHDVIIGEKGISGGGTRLCKGPEVGACLANSGNSRGHCELGESSSWLMRSRRERGNRPCRACSAIIRTDFKKK